MAYEYSGPGLAFDDANNFLSMLLSTVPTLDQPQKWDDRLLYMFDDSLDEYDPSSSEVVASMVSDMPSSIASDMPSSMASDMPSMGSEIVDTMMVNTNSNRNTTSTTTNIDTKSPMINNNLAINEPIAKSMATSMGLSLSSMGDLAIAMEIEPRAGKNNANDSGAGFAPEFVPEFAPDLVPEAATGFTAQTMAPDLMALHSQYATDVPRMLSLSLGSYLDLIGSHFGASADGTPNTAASLPHTLPDMHIKQEVVLPYGMPDMHAGEMMHASELEPDSGDAVLPKLRAAKNKVTKPVRKAKVLHNMIEKKYRTNINSKILELRDAVPTLRIATGKTNVLVAQLEGLLPASKLNKASVLTKATEYIKHLERKNTAMRLQIDRLQGLVHAAATGVNSNTTAATANPPRPNASSMQRTTTAEFFASLEDSASSQAMSSAPSRDGLSSILAGGIAIGASQLMSGDHFRGLAAMPFVPLVLTTPSPLTLQMLNVARTAVFLAGVALVVAPFVGALRSQKSEKGQATDSWLTYALIWAGLKPPQPLAPAVADRVKQHLTGQDRCTTRELMADLAAVGAADVLFESCLLYVLVGVVVSRRWPAAAPALRIGMRWRGDLLTKLECVSRNVAAGRLGALMRTLDGASMFDSARLVQRLDNVAARRPVNAGIDNGENHLNYVELYMRDKRDLYAVVYDWRILEIVHELNLVYLDALTENADKQREMIAEVRSTVRKMDSLLLADTGLVVQYFSLFKCLLFPEETPALVESLKGDIVASVKTVAALVDGYELTDDEEISDDSDRESDHETDRDSSVSTARPAVEDPMAAIAAQKSLVYSMNLMNEEKFIVLTSAMVSYFAQRHEMDKATALVRHLRFKSDNVPLSLLSFTCLVQLLCVVVKADDESDGVVDARYSEVLESLVKMTRRWLSDESRTKYMTYRLRRELLDLVMAKGIALSDM